MANCSPINEGINQLWVVTLGFFSTGIMGAVHCSFALCAFDSCSIDIDFIFSFSVSGNEFLRAKEINYTEPFDLWINYVALTLLTAFFLTLTYIRLRTMRKHN